jgi:hypothetical protein
MIRFTIALNSVMKYTTMRGGKYTYNNAQPLASALKFANVVYAELSFSSGGTGGQVLPDKTSCSM